MAGEHDEPVEKALDTDAVDSADEMTTGQVTDEALAALIDQQWASQDAAAQDGDDVATPGSTVSEQALSADQISEEAVIALIAERDDYLDKLQRSKAEFANARRRLDERAQLQKVQAAASLVEKLLPVLDSCDAALGQGIEEIRPISEALFDVLAAQGLTRLEALGEPFDPEQHEAVMYEAGEGEQVVTETLRTGYLWNDRVLRAAMVKVQG